METNKINEAFTKGYNVQLRYQGPKSSGITWELKSIFSDMEKQGLIKDLDGKGFTKNDAVNLYNTLNKIHQDTNRATNYTQMQEGQEFNYTAEEMKTLAKSAGYEIFDQGLIFKQNAEPSEIHFRGEQYLPFEEIPHYEFDENGNPVDNYYDKDGNLIKSVPHDTTTIEKIIKKAAN